MAANERISTGSFHSLMASGADTIPKEYHRKLLKKIAQLTKVSRKFMYSPAVVTKVIQCSNVIVKDCGTPLD